MRASSRKYENGMEPLTVSPCVSLCWITVLLRVNIAFSNMPRSFSTGTLKSSNS